MEKIREVSDLPLFLVSTGGVDFVEAYHYKREAVRASDCRGP